MPTGADLQVADLHNLETVRSRTAFKSLGWECFEGSNKETVHLPWRAASVTPSARWFTSTAAQLKPLQNGGHIPVG